MAPCSYPRLSRGPPRAACAYQTGLPSSSFLLFLPDFPLSFSLTIFEIYPRGALLYGRWRYTILEGELCSDEIAQLEEEYSRKEESWMDCKSTSENFSHLQFVNIFLSSYLLYVFTFTAKFLPMVHKLLSLFWEHFEYRFDLLELSLSSR